MSIKELKRQFDFDRIMNKDDDMKLIDILGDVERDWMDCNEALDLINEFFDVTPKDKKSSELAPSAEIATVEPFVQSKLRTILEFRDEVLAAFIAKYGYEPDRIIQVQKENMETGVMEWFVVRRSDERMKELAELSSRL